MLPKRYQPEAAWAAISALCTAQDLLHVPTVRQGRKMEAGATRLRVCWVCTNFLCRAVYVSSSLLSAPVVSLHTGQRQTAAHLHARSGALADAVVSCQIGTCVVRAHRVAWGLWSTTFLQVVCERRLCVAQCSPAEVCIQNTGRLMASSIPSHGHSCLATWVAQVCRVCDICSK